MKKSNYFIATIVIIAFSILFNSPKLFSQKAKDTTNSPKPGFIFKYGLGGGDDYLVGSFDLGLNFDLYEISLFYRGGSEWSLMGDNNNNDSFDAFGISYVRSLKYSVLYISGGVGLGFFYAKYKDYLYNNYWSGISYMNTERVVSPCLPIMLEAGFKFGLFSLTGKFDYLINSSNSFYIVTINFGIVI